MLRYFFIPNNQPTLLSVSKAMLLACLKCYQYLYLYVNSIITNLTNSCLWLGFYIYKSIFHFACHKRALLKHKLIRVAIKTIACTQWFLWMGVKADDSTYVTTTPAKRAIIKTALCALALSYLHNSFNHIKIAFPICMLTWNGPGSAVASSQINRLCLPKCHLLSFLSV